MNALAASSAFAFLSVVIHALMAGSAAADNNENCKVWAEAGECDANPGYMRTNCVEACKEYDTETSLEAERIEAEVGHINSFFELQAKNIDGNVMDFETLRGKATIIVNVASYCGYTESHYQGLVNLHRDLAKTGKVEILAFPCNQFGEQEPETCSKIKRFAMDKGVEFTMMDKIDVNGPNAHIVYKYLKKHAGPAKIAWNFATYYVVSPSGDIQSFSGVEPGELKSVVLELVEREEL